MEAYLNMAGPGVSIAIHLKIMNSNIYERQFLQSMDINQDMELSFQSPYTTADHNPFNWPGLWDFLSLGKIILFIILKKGGVLFSCTINAYEKKYFYLYHIAQNERAQEVHIPVAHTRTRVTRAQKNMVISLYFDGRVRTTVRAVAIEVGMAASTAGNYIAVEKRRRLALGMPLFPNRQE